jgi:hypothetical protein
MSCLVLISSNSFSHRYEDGFGTGDCRVFLLNKNRDHWNQRTVSTSADSSTTEHTKPDPSPVFSKGTGGSDSSAGRRVLRLLRACRERRTSEIIPSCRGYLLTTPTTRWWWDWTKRMQWSLCQRPTGKTQTLEFFSSLRHAMQHSRVEKSPMKSTHNAHNFWVLSSEPLSENYNVRIPFR